MQTLLLQKCFEKHIQIFWKSCTNPIQIVWKWSNNCEQTFKKSDRHHTHITSDGHDPRAASAHAQRTRTATAHVQPCMCALQYDIVFLYASEEIATRIALPVCISISSGHLALCSWSKRLTSTISDVASQRPYTEVITPDVLARQLWSTSPSLYK